MKKTLIVLVAFLLTTVAYSEQSKESQAEQSVNKIEGVVVDAKTGEALVGVAIELNNKTLYTGFDGEFTLESQDIVGKQVTATLISYKTTTVDINIISKQFTISLEAE